MNVTLRLVFAAAFLSIMLDSSAAHAQYWRWSQRGGGNNSGRTPVARLIPNASPSPRYNQLPNPATAGLKASYYGTLAANQLATGRFRQGALTGAKSLYNAHNAATGYSARSLPPSGPTGYLTLRQQGIPVHGGYVWDENAKKSTR